MKTLRHIPAVVIFPALIGLLMLFVQVFLDPLLLQTLRVKTFDFYQQVQPRTADQLPVSIVDIDEISLREFGQWPWPRTSLAKLVNNLNAAGASVIGFDMTFPERDRLSQTINQLPKELDDVKNRLLAQLPNADLVFAEAIRNSNVVLGQLARNTQEVNRNEVANPAAERIQLGNITTVETGFSSNQILTNITALNEAAAGHGIFNTTPENDGVVRRVQAVFNVNDELLPSLGLEIMRALLQDEQIKLIGTDNKIESIETGGIKIPVDSRGRAWVHFREHRRSNYISASDVINNKLPAMGLAGHIILVGTSAEALSDVRSTPLGVKMPGVDVWAQWIETSIFGNPLQRPYFIVAAEWIATASLGLMMILLLRRFSALPGLLVLIVLLSGLAYLSWYLYVRHLVLFSAIYSLITGFVVFTTTILFKYQTEEKKRAEIRNAFAHYLSPVLVDQLADNPDSLKLGGEKREITSLFTDLTGFTSMSEELEPEKLVDLINEYLDGLCRIVTDSGGTIDKIIGDAVHGIFGAPVIQADHAQRALECALKMDAFAEAFREKQNALGLNFGVTRIGMHTGEVVVGNFGGEARFDYTAFGDTINTASRLEGVNKHLGTRVCVSAQSLGQTKHPSSRPLGRIVLKGKTSDVPVFELLQAGTPALNYLSRYKLAYEKMLDDSERALAELLALQKDNPEDPVIRLHINRLQEGHRGDRLEMESK